MSERVVVEVVAIEQLPIGANASRRAVVSWSDGDVGEALRWFDDEILVSEGDLLGKTEAQLRSLHSSGTAATCSPKPRSTDEFRRPGRSTSA
jgi:hypothetical protein